MRQNVLLPLLALLASVLWSPMAAADASVASRLDSRGVTWEVDEDGDYRVFYNFASEGRSQLAFVSGGTQTLGGIQIREVFAPAGKVSSDGIDGDKALSLLANNRSRKLGAWELQGDVLYFVIKLPDNVDGAQLETALKVAAEVADDKEIELSGAKDAL